MTSRRSAPSWAGSRPMSATRSWRSRPGQVPGACPQLASDPHHDGPADAGGGRPHPALAAGGGEMHRAHHRDQRDGPQRGGGGAPRRDPARPDGDRRPHQTDPRRGSEGGAAHHLARRSLADGRQSLRRPGAAGVPPALPAQGRTGIGRDHRRRSADALAPSRPRRGLAARLHPVRGILGLHRPADALAGGHRLRAAGRLGGGGRHARHGASTSPRATCTNRNSPSCWRSIAPRPASHPRASRSSSPKPRRCRTPCR